MTAPERHLLQIHWQTISLITRALSRLNELSAPTCCWCRSSFSGASLGYLPRIKLANWGDGRGWGVTEHKLLTFLLWSCVFVWIHSLAASSMNSQHCIPRMHSHSIFTLDWLEIVFHYTSHLTSRTKIIWCIRSNSKNWLAFGSSENVRIKMDNLESGVSSENNWWRDDGFLLNYAYGLVKKLAFADPPLKLPQANLKASLQVHGFCFCEIEWIDPSRKPKCCCLQPQGVTVAPNWTNMTENQQEILFLQEQTFWNACNIWGKWHFYQVTQSCSAFSEWKSRMNKDSMAFKTTGKYSGDSVKVDKPDISPSIDYPSIRPTPAWSACLSSSCGTKINCGVYWQLLHENKVEYDHVCKLRRH